MDYSYWHKQLSTAIDENILWSRPETRSQAGKLLIIGGNVHGFAQPALAFSAATATGIGTIRVLLPDSLQKTVGRQFISGEFGPSTPSGSFSKTALAEFLEFSEWSDAVMLAGELGHNSETAILLEEFLKAYHGPLTICNDAIDYFIKSPLSLIKRQSSLIVLTFLQLQKLATNIRYPQAFTTNMGLLKLIEYLHDFSLVVSANIMVDYLHTQLVAVNGKISTTEFTLAKMPDKAYLAAQATVWWLQNLNKPFEALSTSLYSENK